MKKYAYITRSFLLAFLTISGISCAAASDLVDVYRDALQSDPVLAQARANRDANLEVVPQSRAALLPNLDATASSTSIHTGGLPESSTTGSPSPAGVASLSREESTNARGYELSLTQPIFNFQSWMQLRAAHNSAKQAQAIYNAAVEDLITRVAAAYFNVLQAEDNLTYTEAQKDAIGSQLKQIREKYDVGLATLTDVYQAQASYDALNAQMISDQNTIANNMEALREITGKTYAHLDVLRTGVPLISPLPNDPHKWVLAAERYNWNLLAARYAEQAAKENVRVNYAGHFPTVSAVGSYTNGKNMGLGASNVNQWQTQAGVQVSLPLFQGGLVASKTRQAQDQYVAASEQMEATHRQVIFATQEAFNNITASMSKIQADKLAIDSAQSALDSTQAGFQAGTKTILDVLTAEQNLYQARTTFSIDQYAYINNTLALKSAAGALQGSDVTAINRWLKQHASRH